MGDPKVDHNFNNQPSTCASISTPFHTTQLGLLEMSCVLFGSFSNRRLKHVSAGPWNMSGLSGNLHPSKNNEHMLLGKDSPLESFTADSPSTNPSHELRLHGCESREQNKGPFNTLSAHGSYLAELDSSREVYTGHPANL